MIVLALLAVTVIVLYGLFKDKDNLKPETLDLVITIAQDEFEIDDEPLSVEMYLIFKMQKMFLLNTCQKL